MNNTFKVGKLELNYCYATNNKAWCNERKVEVPLGQWFLQKFGFNVVEVGSVMINYGWDMHIIVDLSDPNPKVLNYNALDCDYNGRDVLSISTAEHMMKREYDNGSDEDSIRFVNMVAEQAKNYLITFPCGYNEFLDTHILNSALPRVILKRINAENEWEQDFDLRNMNYPFAHCDGRVPDGRWNNANAIVIITNLPELLQK